jgi:hypothetical protein
VKRVTEELALDELWLLTETSVLRAERVKGTTPEVSEVTKWG